MRTRILSFAFLLIMIQSFSQENNLKIQRDLLYQDYMQFKDSMTTRTWLNMVNLATKLEAVIEIDNVILDSLEVESPDQTNLEQRIAELTKTKDELILSNAQVNQEFAAVEKSKTILIITSIIMGVLLLTLGIMLFIIIIKYRKISKDTENYMADTLELKRLHKEEIDTFKDQIENYVGEIELLENNALEMKKSFDVMKSEHINQSHNAQPDSSVEIEAIRKEVEELSNELTKVMEERDDFEESLGMANLKLAHQIDLNKKFEADLESLLGRIKGKPKTDQD